MTNATLRIPTPTNAIPSMGTIGASAQHQCLSVNEGYVAKNVAKREGNADFSQVSKAHFWQRVRKADGDECWMWIGGKDGDGYGKYYWRGKRALAHRVGMGKGWEKVEIMLVCHGGAHNDTICIAERRLEDAQADLFNPLSTARSIEAIPPVPVFDEPSSEIPASFADRRAGEFTQ